ncbi:MAG: hypothetical protein L6R42_000876 [Xanthoria sp. 1 TBL-2021]|nr:MAG: hypothetical protein L6R42_000876 [Xanthoria sp. 1 TBL-2021]
MPRPFASLSMSGDFDFPPASSLPPLPSTPSHAQSLQTRQASRANLENQRRLLEAQLHDTEVEINRRHLQTNSGTQPSSQAPTSALRSRSRQVPPNTSFPWLEARGRENRALRGGSQAMQEAMDRLNQASSHISIALNQSASRHRSPNVIPPQSSSEAAVNEEHRQRAKRRKLNDGMLAKSFGPSYGYRGQVVPGRLRMEIVFCDGGQHQSGEEKYSPENVLRNDLSVYCTRTSQCDLVLRHQGGATFCLQKLVIKAPENGFTAPMQEGMVFVTMENEGLIRKASRYVLREAASPSTPSSPRSPDLLIDRYPALDSTPQSSQENGRPPSRRRTNDGSNRVIPPPISSFGGSRSPRGVSNRSWRIDERLQSTDPANAERLRSTDFVHVLSTTGSEPLDSHFNVSIDCENQSDDDEESSSEATLADRLYRDRIPSSQDDSDEADDPDLVQYLYRSGERRRSVPSSSRRHGRRATPRRIELRPPSAAEEGDQEKQNADVLLPHAVIFIEKVKSMVSIKFDPPVSGKYILLKLWSPTKDQNIDIQSIIAYGFAGPRFFPAIEFR